MTRRIVPSVVVFDVGEILALDVMEAMAAKLAGEAAVREEVVLRQFRASWMRFSTGTSGDWVEDERQFWHELVGRLRDDPGMELDPAAWIARTEEFIVPIPGMMDLVAELHTRVGLALCSNNNAFWSARQRRKLDLDRWVPKPAQIFSFGVGIEKASPEFEMFAAVVAATGKPVAEHVFIDDRPGNIGISERYGMKGVLLLSSVPVQDRAAKLRAALRQLGLFD